jgi:RNA polymerase sigma-70 factor, ECF subfamily
VTDATQVDRTFHEEILPELDAVYRFALRLARAPDRAEDLTQETFLRAYRNRAGYSAGTRARSWLFTICRNLFLRGEERHRRHSEVLGEVADEDPRRISREATVFMDARARDPEGAFWNRIVDDEILRAIDRLPTEFQEAVVLSDLEELSYEGIAEILGLPLGTVKSRLFRGRRMLQKELYAYAVEEGIIPPGPASPPHEPEEESG